MTAEVFHLTTPDAWEVARATGRVAPASLETDGFVHCSTLAQVVGTIERHFAADDQLVLLRVPTATLGDALRWEESHPGESYPHLYRALLLHEISGTVRWQRSEDGSVRLPPELA